MDQTQTPSEHPKLDALIAGYLEAVERGGAPARDQIIAENPDLATELRAFFDDLDRVQRAAASPNDGPAPPKPDAAHASTVIRPNNEPTPGVIIAGRYKLLENIGEGGMGSVWVAEQLKPVKRKVAIKLIKPGMDSKQVLARFEAERQALAVMDHPNIAKVFDGGLTEQGRPYFVMEYVKGVPFTDYCDRARLPLKDRLSLFIAVCSAVQHAHQKGIVHRDLKPSNILICLYDGHPVPKVIDFGLAKAMHQPLTEQSIFTGHGVMVGTPLYMSPEQAESNNLDIDTRTDIYSLGVVLYELLTGSTPLERQQLQKAAFDEVLRLIKEVEPPRPSLRLSGSDSLASIAAQRSIDPKQLSRSLSGDLDWIAMKALDKERSRRYETANGLARDIERFLNEEPVEACPPSTAYRVRKFIKRYRPQVTAASIVLVALVAGIIGTTWGLRKAKIAEEKALNSESKTIQALADVTKERDAKEAEREKATRATEESLASAQMLAEQKDKLQSANNKATSLLAEAAQSDRATGRNLWKNGHHLDALAHWARSLEYEPQSTIEVTSILASTQSTAWSTSLYTLLGHKSFFMDAKFSPDGKQIVTASSDTTATIWNAATGQSLIALVGHVSFVNSVDFSLDGKRIATASDDLTARVWDAKSGEPLAILSGHENSIRSAEFNPDGTRIVTASWDKTARVWDAATGQSIAILSGHQDFVVCAKFSPDGQRILTASIDKTARVWDVVTGQSLAILSGHKHAVVSAEFSLDGAMVVTASWDKTAIVWDVASGRSLATLSGHEGTLSNAMFSPDGTRILTASADKTARVWDVASGRTLAILSGHEREVNRAAFSHDGVRIVTASGDSTAIVWDVATGRSLAIFSGHEASLFDAMFSPDETRILTFSGDQTVRVWDAAPRQAFVALSGYSDAVTSAQFNFDGTRILTALSNNTARIWDAATGQSLATLTGHKDLVADAAFSLDGSRVVTASWDDTAKVWDAASGQSLFTLSGHEQHVYNARFSPDGKQIVTASLDNTARTWSAETGQLLISLIGHESFITSAAFSPDGTRIVTASGDKTARVWDSTTGHSLATLSGHEDVVVSASFSPDGTRILTASYDSTAMIWNSVTGKHLSTLSSHEKDNQGYPVSLNSAAFSPGGTLIITASAYGTARIWDSVSGISLVTLPEQTKAVFSPDGTRIITVSLDGAARIWEVIEYRSAPPAWFSTCLRFLGHRSHYPSGEIGVWPKGDEEVQVFNKLQQQIDSDHTRYGVFGRYVLTHGSDKPTYSGSKVTCGEAADRLIRPVALQPEIERAYNWHPTHPLVHIALAKFETEPKRAEFLREYGVSRLLKRQPSLEDSAPELTILCHRAETLLLDQKDQVRADLVHKRAEELAGKP